MPCGSAKVLMPCGTSIDFYLFYLRTVKAHPHISWKMSLSIFRWYRWVKTKTLWIQFCSCYLKGVELHEFRECDQKLQRKHKTMMQIIYFIFGLLPGSYRLVYTFSHSTNILPNVLIKENEAFNDEI